MGCAGGTDRRRPPAGRRAGTARLRRRRQRPDRPRRLHAPGPDRARRGPGPRLRRAREPGRPVHGGRARSSPRRWSSWLGVRPTLVVVGPALPHLRALLSWPGCAAWTGPSTCVTGRSRLLQAGADAGRAAAPGRRAAGPRPGAARRCPPASRVFEQGDVGDRYFVIESGEVEVVGDGEVIATLGPGQGFGEIALLRQVAARTATVRDDRPRSGSRPCAPSSSSRPCWASRPARARQARRSTPCSTASPPRMPRAGADPPQEPLSLGSRDMATERSLLLIADIGGYTNYMSTHRMSLAHAEVNTVEAAGAGDRRRAGVRPDRDRGRRRLPVPAGRRDVRRRCGLLATLAVAAAMHRAFHIERRYVGSGTCAPARGAPRPPACKLKFVAHVGDVATQTIRQQRKLVGIDVILVHRLLKNCVRSRSTSSSPRSSTGSGAATCPSPAPGGPRGPRGLRPDPRVLRRRHRPWRRCLRRDRRPLAPGAPGRTLTVAGAGMPYMLGLRRRRRATSPV